MSDPDSKPESEQESEPEESPEEKNDISKIETLCSQMEGYW